MASQVGAFSDDVRATVVDRAKGRCELCGSRVEAAHFHHRQPRQMGGTSLPSVGGPHNALLLHPRCHDKVESNRTRAYLMGWIVTKQNDPADVAVRLWDGWFFLGSDGILIPASTEDRRAGSSQYKGSETTSRSSPER